MKALKAIALISNILSGLSNCAAGVIVLGEIVHWWDLL